MVTQCSQKPVYHGISQRREALLYPRASEDIPDLREDFGGDAEFDDAQLSEEQTGSRGTFLPRSALEEDHAIEDDAGLSYFPAQK